MFTIYLLFVATAKALDWHEGYKYRRSVRRAELLEAWEKKKATQTPRSAKREKIGLIIFWTIITPPLLYLGYRIIFWLPVSFLY
jgi:hypothetical protein